MISADALPTLQEYPARILVVEDSVLLRYALTEWLRHQGYAVVEAACADEAITVLGSALAVDLVITDIEMPGGMDGLDLARHIWKLYSGLPLIIVSGRVSRDKIKETEGYEFFQKPYVFDEITQRVAKLLSGRSGAENERGIDD